MKYRLSNKAEQDLENIWLYTFENWSLEQADRYTNNILDEIEYISYNPLPGKDYSHIRKGYKCVKVKSHIIFYRLREQEGIIEIIRVLHQRMDMDDRLSE